MKTILTVIVIIYSISFSQIAVAQNSDTIKIQGDKSNLVLIKSKWGWGFGLGINQFNYENNMKKWLGNHGGPNFQGMITYKEWFILLGFRPWTVNPQKKLSFGVDTLDEFADLNPIKTEMAIGYKVYVLPDLFLTPYFGYVNSSFTVVNEDELKKKYSISSASGLTIGGYVNYVFLYSVLDEYSIRLGYNTNIIDFQNVHPSLGKNYWAWEIGLIATGVFSSIKEIPN
jgi:hypothetical protein